MLKSLAPRTALIGYGFALVGSWAAMMLLGIGRGGIPRLLSPVRWQDFALLVAAVIFCGAFGILAGALGRWEDDRLEQRRREGGVGLVGVTSVFGSIGQWGALLLTLLLFYRIGLAAAIALGLTHGDVDRIVVTDVSARTIVFSPDSTIFVLVGYDSAHAYRTVDCKRLWKFSGVREIEKAAFSQDGRFFGLNLRDPEHYLSFRKPESPMDRRWSTASWEEIDAGQSAFSIYDPKEDANTGRRLRLEDGQLLLEQMDGVLKRFHGGDYNGVEVEQFGFSADGIRAFVAFRQKGLNVEIVDTDALASERRISRSSASASVWGVSPDLSYAILCEPYDVTVWRLPQAPAK